MGMSFVKIKVKSHQGSRRGIKGMHKTQPTHHRGAPLLACGHCDNERHTIWVLGYSDTR